MKFIILFLLLSIQPCLAQVDKEDTQELVTVYSDAYIIHNAPSGMNMQKAMHRDGLVYVSAGNLMGHLTEFESFYRNYLWNEHGIASIAYGCSLIGPELQFMNTMNARIKEVHGQSFIKNERSKAKELFLKRA